MSIISAGNTITTSLKQTADTSGNLVFTTGGNNTTALTLDLNQNATIANSATIGGNVTISGSLTAGAVYVNADYWTAYGFQMGGGNGISYTYASDIVTIGNSGTGIRIDNAGAITIGSDAYFNGNITSSAWLTSSNLSVTGNVTYIAVSDLEVSDPIIYIAVDNQDDIVDIGLVGSANISGTYQHLGLVRDYTDGVWKLFGNVVAEPTTIIDWANAVYQGFLAGSISSTGNIVAAGNITGGNLVTLGSLASASYSTAGNVTGGNILTSGVVTAAGNITSSSNISGINLLSSGKISGTGNVTGGNILTGGVISATANITGGNVLTGGVISATGTITSSANITGGNILTAGLVSATGNVTLRENTK